jgi:Lon protease-like protein
MTSTEHIELPPVVGAMVLPGGILYPGSMLPLFIFEPRYRLMLARALESHRVFAVAPDSESGARPGIGGAGLIRACVANEDGTSNLILQGVARVRFSNWSDKQAYPSATIEVLPSVVNSRNECDRRRVECLSLAGDLSSGGEDAFSPQFLDILSQTEDPATFSDLAASCAVHSQPVRLRLLEECDVARRLEILAAYFTHALAAREGHA